MMQRKIRRDVSGSSTGCGGIGCVDREATTAGRSRYRGIAASDGSVEDYFRVNVFHSNG